LFDGAKNRKRAGAGSAAPPAGTPTPTASLSEERSSASPSLTFDVIGERIAAGTPHRDTVGPGPWRPLCRPGRGPNHRWHIRSLDVDGVRVVIQNGDFAGTPPEGPVEMHGIIESIQVHP
jgi:hypothetical protein